MASKHICPKCGGREFYTTAHLIVEWKVNEIGKQIEQTATPADVLDEPDDNNIWTCTSCGAEAIIAPD